MFLIVTGDKLRHQYFALYLLKRFPEARLVVETQAESSWGEHVRVPTILEREHFDGFARTEQEMLSSFVEEGRDLLTERLIRCVSAGELNSIAVIDELCALQPQFFCCLSTSILQDDFISRFGERKILNLHAGLSPYYRGSGTNVFPLIHREPEYIGMTIHYIDAGIDSGAIILQGRPELHATDNSHTIGCKCVQIGAELMARAASSYMKSGPPIGHKQQLDRGRQYYRKEFGEGEIRKLRQVLGEGLMIAYREFLETNLELPPIVDTLSVES